MAKKLSAFEQAFADARKAKQQTFEFKGKTYTTRLKGEKDDGRYTTRPKDKRSTGVTVGDGKPPKPYLDPVKSPRPKPSPGRSTTPNRSPRPAAKGKAPVEETFARTAVKGTTRPSQPKEPKVSGGTSDRSRKGRGGISDGGSMGDVFPRLVKLVTGKGGFSDK